MGDPSPRRDGHGMSRSLTRTATATAAVIAAGVIAWAVGSSTSNSAASSPTAARAQAGQLPQSGQAPPGFGQDVTGSTADKVSKAALAKYPGTVERIMKLPDGSYV